MRKILTLLVLLIGSELSASINEDLKRVYELMQEDREAAKNLLLESKSKNDRLDDNLWMVRSNFYLAYIYELDGEYGKSVIYYLEAIRHSSHASYDGIISERISLHKNIANIFQQFKAQDLATSYNLKALELAESSDNSDEIISIKYNQARNLRINQEYSNAIDLLISILPKSKKERVPRLLNEIGIAFMLNEDWDNAQLYFDRLASLELANPIYKAKSLHNLGEIEYKRGNLEGAIQMLKKSIDVKESLEENNKSLFISYKTLGEYSLFAKNTDEAGLYLGKAEKLFSKIAPSIDHFNIFQLLAEYNYKSGNGESAQYYANIYSSELEEYIQLQEEIQETDKRYNMDLITKRYFDEVEKQAKIASILFYSRLTSGSLLILLLSVIGYNRYEKLRVRKSIEQHLLKLEVIS